MNKKIANKVVYNEKWWVSCPYCGKRQFPISSFTHIFDLSWKCKGSNCKKEFKINI